MIDKFSQLENKIEVIEEELTKANNKNLENKSNTNCVEFTLSPLNISILTNYKIFISKIQFEKDKSLCFQNQIELNLYSDQVVNFRILVDGISIYKTTKSLKAGFNQINMIKSYVPISSFEGDVEIFVEACEEEILTVLSNTLLIWGMIGNIEKELEYKVVETNTNYIISFIENSILYEKIVQKQQNYFSKDDFILKTTAISHDYAYFSANDILYYFRVDKNKNLFYSTNTNSNEIFICSNVETISTSNNSNIILISYVKDDNCFYFEMENNIVSSHKKINLDKKISKTYSYFNSNLDKFFIITTDINNSNYLIESISESSNNSDTLTASYQITATEEV